MKADPAPAFISPEERRRLLALARRAIHAHVCGQVLLETNELLEEFTRRAMQAQGQEQGQGQGQGQERGHVLPEESSERRTGKRRGVFVTLHLRGRLRGCIGRTDSPEHLDSLVPVCAILAASRDPRFPPVRTEEIDVLEIEISILKPAEHVPAATVLERLQPGVHGAAVALGASRGLLLPQVAAEYGWSAQRFLEETCRKAGLPMGAWRDSEARIELFTAEVFSESNDRTSQAQTGEMK